MKTLTILLITGLTLIVVGCTNGGTAPLGQRWEARAVGQSIQNTPVIPIIANSNIGVGRTRLAIALTDRKSGAPLGGAEVRGTLVWLGRSADDTSGASEVRKIDFVPRSLDLSMDSHGETAGASGATGPGGHADHASDPGSMVTMYTALTEFDRSGLWGVELTASSSKFKAEGMRVTFNVQDRTPEPAVGESAPKSAQPVFSPGAEISQFTTSNPPNADLVDTTIASAIASGKPVVVAFVTPAFCVTRFCGPVLQAAISPVYRDLQDRVEFVQVEPYDLKKARSGAGLDPVPVVMEWKLESEPFVFVLAPGGTVAAKFEGVMDAQELRDALAALVK